ncbi:MAG TPA: hypothetical protein VN081_03175 [Dongiaceae bacterium]|nr:hypothetical protein [Dongiaceae bacterium]
MSENKIEGKGARFTTGKDYFFINVDFKKGAGSFFPLFQPWLGDTITKIDIVKLHCDECHSVKWRYDDKEDSKDFEGFVFTDSTGARWFNQYPLADFGQLDDSANWLATREKPSSDQDPWYSYRKIQMYLENLGDGIRRFRKTDDTTDEGELRMRPIAADGLQKHFDEIVEKLKTEFNVAVEVGPRILTYKCKDTGEEETITFEDRVKVTLVP